MFIERSIEDEQIVKLWLVRKKGFLNICSIYNIFLNINIYFTSYEQLFLYAFDRSKAYFSRINYEKEDCGDSEDSSASWIVQVTKVLTHIGETTAVPK